MKAKITLLFVGLAAGLAGGYQGRPAMDRLVGQSEEVEGVVVDERREADRLVLTLRAGEETLLASFHERADDVEGLVSPGDYLTIRVGARGVFADEVPIVRLRRAADLPPADAEPAETARERGGGEDEEADEDGEADEDEEADEDGEAREDDETEEADEDEPARETPVASTEASPRRRRDG